MARLFPETLPLPLMLAMAWSPLVAAPGCHCRYSADDSAAAAEISGSLDFCAVPHGMVASRALLVHNVSTTPTVSADSQALPTQVLVTEDSTVIITDLDGVSETRDLSANQTLRTAEAGYPTLLREGVGINTSFLEKNRSTNFNLRLGYGMRQNLYGGALVLDDIASTDEFEYREVDTWFEQGVEATIVASLRLPGWVVYATDVELFVPFQSFELRTGPGEDRILPAVSWRNTLSVRLTRNLALNYYLNIVYEPQVLDKRQVEQSLVLRTSWAVF